MSRYQQSSPVPWIAAVVLLAAFIGVIVWVTGGKEPEVAGRPVAYREPAPTPAPVREQPPVEIPVAPPPKPRLTAAQAEKRLRIATKEWRAFTLKLCRSQRWPQERAVAFLEKVTWSDRDLEKQHLNGLTSIRMMLGVETEDAVALAKALEKEGGLSAFFEQRWPKVDVDWTAKPKQEEVALEDAWKPNRIRWGFPLDTPVQKLQEFKVVHLKTSVDTWRALAGTHVQGLEIDNDAKMAKFRAAVGEGHLAQEAKMHAAFRVLLDMPDASVREVVEKMFGKIQEGNREEFIRSLLGKADAALKAAEKAG